MVDMLFILVVQLVVMISLNVKILGLKQIPTLGNIGGKEKKGRGECTDG